MMPVVILADGCFPQHPFPLKILELADFIVCCDGAVAKLVNWGRKPNAIVGDLDSISPKLKSQFADIIYQSNDYETNDLTKAVEWCVNKEIDNIVILGATGLRDDHSLANIS